MIELLWLFLKGTLTTIYSKEGINITYPPFIKEKHITWNDVEKVYTRNYNSMKEFGGWGIRTNGAGKA